MTPALSIFQQVRGFKNNAQKGKGKKKEVKTDRKGPREFPTEEPAGYGAIRSV